MNSVISFFSPSRRRGSSPRTPVRNNSPANESDTNKTSSPDNDSQLSEAAADEAALQEQLRLSANSVASELSAGEASALVTFQPEGPVSLIGITDRIKQISGRQSQFNAVGLIKKQIVKNLLDAGDEAAKLSQFEKEERLWEAGNRTEAEVQAEYPEYENFLKRSTESRKKLQRRDDKMRGWKEPRAVAFREYFETVEEWQHNVSLTIPLIHALHQAKSQIDGCRAINTAILERLQRVLAKSEEQGVRNPGNRCPGPCNDDTKTITTLLKKKASVKLPSTTSTFLKENGLTMLPCGILGPFKDEFSTTSLSFPGEVGKPEGERTLRVRNNEVGMATRHTPRKTIKAKKAYTIEIPDSESDRDTSPSPSASRKRVASDVEVKVEGKRDAKKQKKKGQ